jgi:hypothetical protein
MTQENQFNGKTYDEVWSDRFQFFQQNGSPGSKTCKEAIKPLPLIRKLRMSLNFYAFFFSFIYFLIKGMWKPAITILVVEIAIWYCSSLISGPFGSYLRLLSPIICGFTANYTYYRKEVLGELDFNIFKGNI